MHITLTGFTLTLSKSLPRTLPCPICGAEINVEEQEIMGHLSTWGYMHVDYWLRCPRCKFSPCFGREMEDTHPIYWNPHDLPDWYKDGVEAAAATHVPPFTCLFCTSQMELHKVWVNSYRELCDGPTQFITPTHKGAEGTPDAQVQRYFLPSGILLQYKCVNWRCKYVRYVTL